ncbi:MAG: Inner membrane protein CreD [Haliscomenobacter sp.]|jgi:inner membrane protein|nr:Inner membrane protein CreD [Haliscomenobacter sp.]
METQESSYGQKFGNWLRRSLAVKLLAIGFLTLLLMLPNGLILNLISERQSRMSEASAEVSASWGPAQTLTGPILSIPYTEWTDLEDGKRIASKRLAHFLPETFEVDGKQRHQIRKRGIFEVILYETDLQLKGAFAAPDFQALHILPENILWDEAVVSLGITGMNGIRKELLLDWGQAPPLRMEPGTAAPGLLESGVRSPVPVQKGETEYPFSLGLSLNGSSSLHFSPVGKTTNIRLASDWPSPSFNGNFLPTNRNISATGAKKGFEAEWQVLDLNRNFPQQWVGEAYHPDQSAFGVQLIEPVDNYLKNTRSAKYAILVIGLTFLIYFFFETLKHVHIHPFQYFLVGLAIMVFYLLLLSLSEHIGYDLAYLSGAVATIGLVAAYSASILRSPRMTAQLALLLSAIYAFIYIVLQLEDFALLAGSLGVFAALAIVMWTSRKVDWYQL